MKKNDLKKLVLFGFAAGCLTVSGSASANDDSKTTHSDLFATTEKSGGDLLATTEKSNEDSLAAIEKTHDQVFAAGCGNGKCGGRSAPKNGRVQNDYDEEQQQGQGNGHSCASHSGQSHSCASQSRGYQGRNA